MSDETKPEVDAINLKVASQDGNDIYFKVRLIGIHSASRLPTYYLGWRASDEDNAAGKTHECLLPAAGASVRVSALPVRRHPPYSAPDPWGGAITHVTPAQHPPAA
eukprot:scaffold215958_cov30-Tisochrysis_lutea.AAC.1